MSRRIWWCAATLVTGLGLIGCDDGAADPDAAVQPTVDASGDGPLEDGAPPDAMPAPDAGPDAAPDAAAEPDAAPDAAPAVDAGPPGPGCARGYLAPVVAGTLAGDTLVEVSGIAASATRDNVLWMHVDSGGEPALYAVDTSGNMRGEVRLPVPNTDWEDLAAAPCPNGQGPCLWIADTGDNFLQRQDVAVYAVPEPVVVAGEVERVWRYPIAYPDGPTDVEALIVAPDGSTFWLFEKNDDGRARVFRHPGPLTDGLRATMDTVVEFDTPGIPVANGRSITGADLDQTGTQLLIRVYTGSYLYDLRPNGWLTALDAVEPATVAIGPLSEQQGEAIAWDADGRTVWTASEDPDDVGDQPLHRYDCQD